MAGLFDLEGNSPQAATGGTGLFGNSGDFITKERAQIANDFTRDYEDRKNPFRMLGGALKTINLQNSPEVQQMKQADETMAKYNDMITSQDPAQQKQGWMGIAKDLDRGNQKGILMAIREANAIKIEKPETVDQWEVQFEEKDVPGKGKMLFQVEVNKRNGARKNMSLVKDDEIKTPKDKLWSLIDTNGEVQYQMPVDENGTPNLKLVPQEDKEMVARLLAGGADWKQGHRMPSIDDRLSKPPVEPQSLPPTERQVAVTQFKPFISESSLYDLESDQEELAAVSMAKAAMDLQKQTKLSVVDSELIIRTLLEQPSADDPDFGRYEINDWGNNTFDKVGFDRDIIAIQEKYKTLAPDVKAQVQKFAKESGKTFGEVFAVMVTQGQLGEL